LLNALGIALKRVLPRFFLLERHAQVQP
jgi:hypothetical protein